MPLSRLSESALPLRASTVAEFSRSAFATPIGSGLGLLALGLVLFLFAANTASGQTGALTVSGQVMDRDGRAIEGVELSLRPLRSRYAHGLGILDGEPLAAATAVAFSDRQGWFELEAPAVGLYQVQTRADGFAPMKIRITPLLRPTILEPVTLLASRPLRVRVIDEQSGHPIAGSRVQLESIEGEPWEDRDTGSDRWQPADRWAETGQGGSATVPFVVGEQALAKVFTADRWIRTHRRIRSGDAVDLELPRADLFDSGMEIRVVDPGGRPMAEVVVFRGHHPIAKTDEEGLVRLPPSAVSDPEVVRGLVFFAADGSIWSRVSLDSGQIRLPEARFVEGRVVTRDTRSAESEIALAGAVVWSTYRRWDTHSGRDGTFFWPLDNSGRYGLKAAVEGYEIGVETRQGGPDGPLRLVLSPNHGLVGRVVDRQGRALEGTIVQLFDAAQSQTPSARAEKQTVADYAGRFRLDGLEADRDYLIKAYRAGFSPAAVPARVFEEIELVLARGLLLQGTLVDARGAALEGGRIEVVHAADEDEARIRYGGKGLLVPAVTSDENGAFEIGGLPKARLAIRASAEGHVPTILTDVRVETEEDGELGEIRLAASTDFDIWVRGQDGRPIEGATVSLFEQGHDARALRAEQLFRDAPAQSSQTDLDGRYRAEGWSQGSQVSIHVHHPGYLAEQHSVVVDELPVEIVLFTGGVIAGRVVDDAGEPVPRARIRLEGTELSATGIGSSSSTQYLFTDEGGNFREKDLSPGTFRIAASRPDAEIMPAPSRILTLERGEIVEGLEIVVGSKVELRGRVVDPDGGPAAGAEVRIGIRTGPSSFDAFDYLADDSGDFVAPYVPAGPVTISARHDLLGEAKKEIELEPGMAPVTIRLEPKMFIGGIVSDVRGEPVAGAHVRLEKPSSWNRGFSLSDISNSEGRFRLPAEPETEYVLKASSESSRVRSVPVVTALESIANLEIRLEPGSRLVGTITRADEEDRSPIEITAKPQRSATDTGSGGIHRRGSVGIDGRYEIVGLGPGVWQLVASTRGTARRTIRMVEVPEGWEETIFDFELDEGGGVLEGIVHHNGLPAAGVRIRPGNVLTDGEGRFRIGGMDAGAYELTLSGPWGDRRERGRLTGSGDFLELHYTTHRLAGHVLSPSGEPIDGALIQVLDTVTDERARRAKTDGDGRFELAAVFPGAYRVFAQTWPDLQSATAEVDLRADTDSLVLRLGRSTEVRIEVEWPPGASSTWPKALFFDSNNGLVHRTKAEVDPGNPNLLRIPNVPEGDWAMTLSDQGMVPERFSVRVPGEPYRVRLRPASRLRIVLGEGRPSSAEVEIRDSEGRIFSPTILGASLDTWPLRGRIFDLEFLPAGTWRVKVILGAGGVLERAAVTRAGETTELFFE